MATHSACRIESAAGTAIWLLRLVAVTLIPLTVALVSQPAQAEGLQGARILVMLTIVGGVSPVTRASSLRVVSSVSRIAWSTMRWL